VAKTFAFPAAMNFASSRFEQSQSFPLVGDSQTVPHMRHSSDALASALDDREDISCSIATRIALVLYVLPSAKAFQVDERADKEIP
jgi:hypothetical protein